jgi:T-lymphoma invasion and metastasis-inducing protein 1
LTANILFVSSKYSLRILIREGKFLCDDCLLSGIIKGDEIMVINGAIVSDLDMMYLESVLQEEVGLCMMMRSSRTEPPDLTGIMRVTDDIIESLVCPPPPTDPPVISEEMISGLIVPAPGWSKSLRFISSKKLLH